MTCEAHVTGWLEPPPGARRPRCPTASWQLRLLLSGGGLRSTPPPALQSANNGPGEKPLGNHASRAWPVHSTHPASASPWTLLTRLLPPAAQAPSLPQPAPQPCAAPPRIHAPSSTLRLRKGQVVWGPSPAPGGVASSGLAEGESQDPWVPPKSFPKQTGFSAAARK